MSDSLSLGKAIPVWLPVGISVVTIVASVGASWTAGQMTNGFQDRRLDAIEMDRALKMRDYEDFKRDVAEKVARMDERTRGTADTVNRIADKLGVIR